MKERKKKGKQIIVNRKPSSPLRGNNTTPSSPNFIINVNYSRQHSNPIM